MQADTYKSQQYTAPLFYSVIYPVQVLSSFNYFLAGRVNWNVQHDEMQSWDYHYELELPEKAAGNHVRIR